jgi:hypothetical protein
VHDPGWLRTGLAAFDDGVATVSGHVLVPLGEHPTDYERNAALLPGAGFVTANCFCRGDALDRVGAFDERYEAAWREDSDLRFALDETGLPIAHPPGTPGRKRCSWPWTGAYISYEGRAMPCCMVSTPDRINFGNMAERGVGPIWDSEEFRAFRAGLDSDDPPDLCKS